MEHKNCVKNWSITSKLMSLMVVSGLSMLILINWVSIHKGMSALQTQQSRSLQAVLNSRKNYIESYFKVVREQILNLSNSPIILEGAVRFSVSFEKMNRVMSEFPGHNSKVYENILEYYENEYQPRLSGVPTLPWENTESFIPQAPGARLLQFMYISNNPHPVGEKDKLDVASIENEYNSTHEYIHPYIRNFLKSFGYYDIFLFDLKGNMVYSVFKETDFATNFVTGPYQRSSLSKVYNNARDAGGPDEVFFSDFESYIPSYGKPASFIGSPVFSKNRKIGVLIFQLGVDHINKIMADFSGLGDTGEAYLVGQDGLMRTDSRATEESTILRQKVDTEAVKYALAGETGVLKQFGYRGKNVLTAYSPIKIKDLNDLNWVIITEVEMDEIIAPALGLRNHIVGLSILIATLTCLLAYLALKKYVIAPVHQLFEGALSVQNGDYQQQVKFKSSDELGQLACAFNQMTNSIREDIEERKKIELELRQSEGKYRSLVEGLRHEYVFYSIDIDRNINYVSPSIKNVLGYSQEESLGPVERFFTDNPMNQKIHEMLKISHSGKIPPPYELEIQKKDGSTAIMEIVEFPVFGENNEVVGVEGIAHDITERRENERSLRDKNEQIQQELDLAARVHGTLIPQNVENDKVNIVISYLPMSAIGGDYANYHFLDEDHLIVMISDVTGHGVPAALLVNRLDTEFKRLAEQGKSPGTLLQEMNQFIKNNFRGTAMYLSAFCAFLDFKEKKLSFSNYGHPPQYLYKVSNSDIVSLRSHTTLLGIPMVGEEGHFEDIIDFNEGDRILLFTDGVTESKNASRELFGEDRLKNFLCKNSQQENRTLNKKLIEELKSFQKGSFNDDIYVLNIKIKEMSGHKQFFSYPSQATQVKEAFNEVSGFIKDLELDESTLFNLKLCFTEAFANAVKHGNKSKKELRVDVEVVKDKDKVVISVTDQGDGYDVTKLADCTQKGNLTKEHGRGVHLIKHLMDEVRFDKNGCRIIMIKKLG